MISKYSVEKGKVEGDVQKYTATIGDSKYDAVVSLYQPKEDELARIKEIQRAYDIGIDNLNKARPEFNDLSLLQRATVDKLAYNNYLPGDGELYEGANEEWRSNAQRPIIRSKILSIGAHATAKLMTPKVFACNDSSEEQKDAEEVMSILMDLDNNRAKWAKTYLYATLSALFQPASIVYREFVDKYKIVRKNEDGKSTTVKIKDEDESGSESINVPIEELLVPNFFESDIQCQDWVIWRRIKSIDYINLKYDGQPNLKYVKPGVNVAFDDTTELFYEIYDDRMQDYLCREVIYWNKSKDLKICTVNGVIMGDVNNPNPRDDKKYPFSKMYFEPIDEGRFFYGMSGAAKLAQDGKIMNTLYRMLLDGSYLDIMPPTVVTGGDRLSNDVMIPGLSTTLSDPNSDIRPITRGSNMSSGITMLTEVGKSIDDTSVSPISQGQATGSTNTAYEISRLEQNAAMLLGLFAKMQGEFVVQYGILQKGDILQYYTRADVDKLLGEDSLSYEKFIVPANLESGRKDTSIIELEDFEVGEEKELDESYKVLEREENSKNNDISIYKVNPSLFRKMKFSLIVDSDTVNPRSKDLERAYKLEAYDRAIANPLVDQKEVTKDFLLGAYTDLFKNTDKYIVEENPLESPQMVGASTEGQEMTPSADIMKNTNQINNLTNRV